MSLVQDLLNNSITMKHLLLIAILATQISTVGTSYASGLIAGAIEPTQILNNIELIGVNISDATTAFSTEGDFVTNTIIKPITQGLINAAQEQMASEITTWANGGFGGDALILPDAQRYLQDQALNQVKIALADLPQDGLFSDSIFSTLVGKYKNVDDLGAQLTELSQSNIPAIIQKNICDDATLSSLALSDVQLADGTFVNEALVARKNELWNYACAGDPATNPEVARRLDDLNNQRPEIGGWDSWLDVTGGNNDYTRSTKVDILVAEAAAEKARLAERKVFDGEGAINQTRCEEYAGPTQEGVAPLCKKTVTLTPSEFIDSTISAAVTSKLDRLTNLTPDGLASFFATLAVTKLTAGLNQTISGAFSGSGSTNNTATPIGSSAPVRQDLLSDPARRDELLRPMTKQITYYLSTLDSLEAVDQTYLSDVAAYEARLSVGRMCYNQLVADGLTTAADPAFGFYANRQARIDAIRATISNDTTKIAEARTYIAQVTSQLSTSNSTQEMSTIFNGYMDVVDTRNFPGIQTTATRKGEYTKNRSDSTNDADVGRYETTCAQIRASANFQNGGEN